jgi:hypothetical protein
LRLNSAVILPPSSSSQSCKVLSGRQLPLLSRAALIGRPLALILGTGSCAPACAQRTGLSVGRHQPVHLGWARPGRRDQPVSLHSDRSRSRTAAGGGDLPEHQSQQLCADHLSPRRTDAVSAGEPRW